MEGGGEAKKRKKPHRSCGRDVENGGDLGGNRKLRRFCDERIINQLDCNSQR